MFSKCPPGIQKECLASLFYGRKVRQREREALERSSFLLGANEAKGYSTEFFSMEEETTMLFEKGRRTKEVRKVAETKLLFMRKCGLFFRRETLADLDS